ncbi:MAG: hypothetical protein V1722_00265 [Candidatus Micrarchaeota archaeon]
MGLWKKAVRGNLSEATVRRLRPGFVAARRGGRLDYFRDTADVLGTMGQMTRRQENAILKTGKILASRPPIVRESFIHSFMLSLPERELRYLNRKYKLTDESLSTEEGRTEAKKEFSRLVARQGKSYLEKVLTHKDVVEQVDVAGRRFFGKNVAAVYMKAAKGRKGFNLRELFSKSTARDEIASGILSAIEDLGLKPNKHDPDPDPVDVSEGEAAPHSGDIPDVSEPGDHGGAAHVDVSEPDGTGAAATVAVSGEDPAAVSGEATSGAGILKATLGEVYADRDLHLHSLMMRGLALHKPSRHFFAGNEEPMRSDALNELLYHANEFSAKVSAAGFGSSINADHMRSFANAALNTSSIRNFQSRLKTVIMAQGGNSKIISRLIPEGHKFFIGPRGAKPSVDNLDELRIGKTAEDAIKLTPLQKQMVAFHTSAQLAKVGASVAGAPHELPRESLATLAYHSRGLRNLNVRNFSNLQLAPIEVDAKDKARVALAFLAEAHNNSLSPEQRLHIVSSILRK